MALGMTKCNVTSLEIPESMADRTVGAKPSPGRKYNFTPPIRVTHITDTTQCD